MKCLSFSMRLLWDYGQLLQSPGIPGKSMRDVETAAVAAIPRRRDTVERIRAHGKAVPAPGGAGGPQRHERRSDVMR